MVVLEKLRRATKASHDALERDLDIFRHFASLEAHRRLMARLHALHAAAEAALAPHLAPLADLRFEERLKTPALLRDLRSLNAPAREGQAIEPPRLSNRTEALGFMYVLEGATLGGRLIRKRLAARGEPLVGTSFFDIYGAETGDRWREFCAVLERACADRPDQAVHGAQFAFRFMRAGLLGE
jgi:heme oxygenase